MVRRNLDLKKFAAGLKGLAEQDEVGYVLPDDMDRNRFELFTRILEAKNSSELEDLSIEDICSLFEDYEKMLFVFSDETILHHEVELFNRLNYLKSSLLQRRIL